MNQGISLCMIIKNEENILEDCLNLIKDLADEIIIVDTGSTDKSKEIARRFTDKVFDFKWDNNFSDARNFAISKATQKWILSFDADEKIAEKDKQKIRNLISQNEADAYLFNWRDYTNDSRTEGWATSQGDEYEESKIATGFGVDKVLRFFKNKKEYFFEGIIHETPHASIEENKGRVLDTDIIMHHFGSLNKEKFLDKKKMYSDLLKERLNKKDFSEKTEDYICYELAKELTNLEKNQEAIYYLERAIEINERLEYLHALGSLYLLENDLEKAERIFKKIAPLEPKDHHVHHNLGVIYAKKNDYNKAIRKFEKAIKLNPNFAIAHFNLGLVYRNKGKKQKMNECFEKAINLNPEYKKKISI